MGAASTNSYYRNDLGLSDSYATGKSVRQLQSGTALSGFDTSIWSFKSGEYPQLKALLPHYLVKMPVNNGYVSIVTVEGDNIVLQFDGEKEWKVESVYVNNINLTDSLSGNRLYLHDVVEDKMVEVVFSQTSSDINSAKVSSNAKIRLSDGALLVDGIDKPTNIAIYDLQGKMIKSIKAISNVKILLNDGIYIVRLGAQSYKVAINH